MQLIHSTSILMMAALFCSTSLMAQNDTIPVAKDSSKVHLEDIEVNFLMSYYQQDGIHSPVTGGQGTEELTNIAPSVNINIPLDTVRTLNIDAGVDFYSSASSDNINNPYLDPSHVSGPSGNDERSYATAVYKRKKGQHEWGATAGASFEWDVFSYSAGLSYGLESKDKNRSINLKATYYFDDWKLIYPIELRNGEEELLPTDKRHSINSSAVFSANLSRRIAISVVGDLVFQSGLLSTPFHRVYFQGVDRAVIENLPNQRLKYPVGVRLNVHLTDFLILKSFYRYYMDSWGLTANTFELTLPLKVGNAFRFYPFYRLHIQGAADYFKPFSEHTAGTEFYTSDFDLSGFTSHKVGMGLSYAPLFGLMHFKYSKGKVAYIKAINLRFGYYDRSDGLTAGIVTGGFQMNFKRH